MTLNITEAKDKIKNIYVREYVSILGETRTEVGTTGYCGGDTGHGCRTYFSLRMDGDMRVKVDGDEIEGNPGVIEIAFGGDDELSAFIESLEFVVNELNRLISNGE